MTIETKPYNATSTFNTSPNDRTRRGIDVDYWDLTAGDTEPDVRPTYATPHNSQDEVVETEESIALARRRYQ